MLDLPVGMRERLLAHAYCSFDTELRRTVTGLRSGCSSGGPLPSKFRGHETGMRHGHILTCAVLHKVDSDIVGVSGDPVEEVQEARGLEIGRETFRRMPWITAAPVLSGATSYRISPKQMASM